MPITTVTVKKIRQQFMKYNREKITVVYFRYKAKVTLEQRYRKIFTKKLQTNITPVKEEKEQEEKNNNSYKKQ